MRKPPLALVVIGILFFAAQLALNTRSSTEGDRNVFAAPPQALEYFTFGFGANMADSLWIRWLQNGDECHTYQLAPGQEASLPPTRVSHTEGAIRNKVCDLSWSYLMLDAVSRLQPRFKLTYTAGLMMLTVLVEDYKGATALYDRALKYYPDDWQINFHGAYHFIYDDEDLPRAAQLLEHAAKMGGPPWLPLLASRLYSRSGQAELGLSALKAYRETVDNDSDRQKIDERIEKLKKQIASPGNSP